MANLTAAPVAPPKPMTEAEVQAALAEHQRWVDGGDGSPAVLRGADLSGLDLSGRNLSGIKLRGATLRDTVFDGATFQFADPSGCDMRGARARAEFGSAAGRGRGGQDR